MSRPCRLLVDYTRLDKIGAIWANHRTRLIQAYSPVTDLLVKKYVIGRALHSAPAVSLSSSATLLNEWSRVCDLMVLLLCAYIHPSWPNLNHNDQSDGLRCEHFVYLTNTLAQHWTNIGSVYRVGWDWETTDTIPANKNSPPNVNVKLGQRHRR